LHATQAFLDPSEYEILRYIEANPKEANKYAEQLLDPNWQNRKIAVDGPIVNKPVMEECDAHNIEEGTEAGYYYLSYNK
jgi:ABC-type nitrate/sulfonate/bicarbonate transport system substrate-binding protein